VLLDVMMPKMTGYEVCRRLREKFPANEVPILLLTAKTQVASLVEGLDAGANDYLTKPVSKNELLARIKTHLQLSNLNIAYGRFVPHQFIQLMDKQSVVDVKLGDHVEKEMTILFSDIRGFTSISETMKPQENFDFINAYLSRMEPIIAKHNGFIDKYIGDAIMALFPVNVDNAVQAAVRMLQRLVDYNSTRGRPGRPMLKIGIGIHTGWSMLGTVGGENRMDGTVIADAVNLASRTEGMTKIYGVALLITEQVFQKLQNPSEYKIRVIDRVKVKGKTIEVTLYEVFDGDPPIQLSLKQRTLKDFEQGFRFYHNQQIAAALACFQRVLYLNPEDHAAKVYLDRCKEHLA
jgi:two-component system sensor histidine kinase ChiS